MEKKVHFKDGTSILVTDGITWEYENDSNWEMTVPITDDEFKPGEEVEVSDGEDKDNYLDGEKFLCISSKGLFVTEDNEGHTSSWIHCRRPQPKMQKWNVWKSQHGNDFLVREDRIGMPLHYTKVHTFEIPA